MIPSASVGEGRLILIWMVDLTADYLDWSEPVGHPKKPRIFLLFGRFILPLALIGPACRNSSAKQILRKYAGRRTCVTAMQLRQHCSPTGKCSELCPVGMPGCFSCR